MPMQTNCTFPGCPNFGRYCRRIHTKEEAQAQPKEKKKGIAKVSEKRKAEDREDRKNNPIDKEAVCMINIPGVCIKRPVHWHHIEGRSSQDTRTNPKKKVPACDPCNLEIEKNSALAKKMGWKKTPELSKKPILSRLK